MYYIPMGRPKRVPDDAIEMHRSIEQMAGIGLSQRQIANILGIHENTLSDYKGKDGSPVSVALARGKAQAENDVGAALLKKALTGDMQAIRWWEATRAGRSETVRQEHTHTLTPAQRTQRIHELIAINSARALEIDNDRQPKLLPVLDSPTDQPIPDQLDSTDQPARSVDPDG